MAEDWSIDVRKYVPDADAGIIAGIIRHCGIALQSRDASLVAFSDKTETDRVRENFLKKKLALTAPDTELDSAIAAVGQRMKGDRTKNRVTVYYLLAEHYGLLSLFDKGASAASKAAARPAADLPTEPESKSAGAAALGIAGLGAAGLAAAGDKAADLGKAGVETVKTGAADLGAATTDAAKAGVDGLASAGAAAVGLGAAGLAAGTAAVTGALGKTDAAIGGVPPVAATYAGSTPTATTAQAFGGGAAYDEVEEKSGIGRWLPWLLLALALLALFLYLTFGTKKAEAPVASTDASLAAPAPEVSTPVVAPPAAPAAIPVGAGVTTETRDGKPAVIVYFDTGKAFVVPAFGPAAVSLKGYLDANPGSKLAVSGFNDKTGNAAKNAELSKDRAKAVEAALTLAGIPADAIELVKPSDATDTGTTNAEARRVEVVIK